MARLSRPGFGCNVPSRAKSSKMIQPHQVHMSEQRFEPIDAPAIARSMERFTIKHRITPQWSLRAEIVRRQPGHKSGSEMFIELKRFGIGPDITRVLRDEERQIPDQEYSAFVSIFLKTFSLTEQKELS